MKTLEEHITILKNIEQNKRLDIGCGDTRTEEYIHLDKFRTSTADIIADIDLSLPFKSESFISVRASHVLEHINNFEKVMAELHRILKPNGCLFITVPYFSHCEAHSPFHKLYYNWHSFDPFTKRNSNWNTREQWICVDKKFIFYKGTVLYIIEMIVELLANKFPEVYQKWLAYLFPARKMKIILQKPKEA